MTKEDAANILDLKTRPEALADFVGPELAGMVHQAMIMGAEALRGPQPDPITGLVPCGCAGKPEYHSSKYGYVASVKMHAECSECHAKTAEYYAFLYSDDAFEVLQRKVMDAWNTMRGYKK